MNFVDRYLSKVPNIELIYVQLVGLVGLFIANKQEELYPREIKLFQISEAYTKDNVREMERSMVSELGYYLNPVTLDEELS